MYNAVCASCGFIYKSIDIDDVVSSITSHLSNRKCIHAFIVPYYHNGWQYSFAYVYKYCENCSVNIKEFDEDYEAPEVIVI